MSNTHSSKYKYILAALVGAAAGGVIVALTTRAVPKIMPKMTAGMKAKMMSQMKGCGGEAGDMCERMMARTGQAPQHMTCEA